MPIIIKQKFVYVCIYIVCFGFYAEIPVPKPIFRLLVIINLVIYSGQEAVDGPISAKTYLLSYNSTNIIFTIYLNYKYLIHFDNKLDKQ